MRNIALIKRTYGHNKNEVRHILEMKKYNDINIKKASALFANADA